METQYRPALDTVRSALIILRRKQVEAETGLARSTIYLRMQSGTFPPSISLGPRCVGWRRGDIDAWLANPSGYRSPQEAA
jgi:prophage regulatory protein